MAYLFKLIEDIIDLNSNYLNIISCFIKASFSLNFILKTNILNFTLLKILFYIFIIYFLLNIIYNFHFSY